MDYTSLLRFKKAIGISICFYIAAILKEFGYVFQSAFTTDGYVCKWFCGTASMYTLFFLVMLYAALSLYVFVNKEKNKPTVTQSTIEHTQEDKKTTSFSKVVFITLFICFFLIILGGVYSLTHEISIGVLLFSAVVGGAIAFVFYVPMLWLL